MAKCGEKCEVYSRIVGYLRPVQNWNEGKVAEFHHRRTLDRGWHAVLSETPDRVGGSASEESHIGQIAAG